MAHPTAHQSFREEERVRHIGTSRYFIVWIALLVLTALTVITAKAIELPHAWGLVLALVIAFVKASLVALFFMHLWDHGGVNRLVLVTSLVFLALLMGLTVLDNATRFQLSNPTNDRTMRVMPPGPDILSPMVQPHGEYVPGRQQNNGGGPQQNSGGGSGKPTGSD